jgi:hypothetical protein
MHRSEKLSSPPAGVQDKLPVLRLTSDNRRRTAWIGSDASLWHAPAGAGRGFTLLEVFVKRISVYCRFGGLEHSATARFCMRQHTLHVEAPYG